MREGKIDSSMQPPVRKLADNTDNKDVQEGFVTTWLMNVDNKKPLRVWDGNLLINMM